MASVRRPRFAARAAALAQSALLVAGMFAGVAPASVSAATNYGLALNGSSQYVTFGGTTALGASQFTLELWFNRTGAGVGTSTGTGGIASAIPLLTKGRAEAEGSNVDMNYFLGIDATSGKLVADFEEGTGGTGPLGLNHPVSGNTVVTSNAWHHVAATYDGTWKLYLDGNLDATLAVNQPPRADSIQHAALGTAMTSTGAAAGFFQGAIDEARIWNVARTQAQIQAAKDTDITSAQTGLVGHWGLNEGAGTIANNTFGTAAVNGTLVATPAWTSGYVVPVANLAPAVTLNAPADAATGTSTGPTLSVTPTDPENQPLTVSFYGRPFRSGVFAALATVPGVTSGTTTSTTWSGLGSGQRYEWYVTVTDGATTTTGPTWTFTTAPGSDPVLVGAGDIAYCPDASTNTGSTTAPILDGVAGTIFTAGDDAYLSGSPTEFANCYDPSWGGAPSHALKARTLLPVPGNHEYGTSGATGYFGYFGSTAGPAGLGYYSYDVPASNWHVVTLNTECAQVGGCIAGSAQETWFRSDLAANSTKNVIVIWHKPRWSSGTTNLTELQAFWDDAYTYGVDLVLVGHDHVYERFAPMDASGAADPANGVTQITIGTGGEGHHTFGTIKATSVVHNSDTFGVLKLTLHPASFDWVFLPEPGRTFTDRGTQAVHDGTNTAPVVDSVTISPAAPTTTQTLSATVTSHDADGDPLTTAYQWTKNGTDIAGATGPTLDLAAAGNGDRGDVIRVRVTVSDGIATSSPLTSSPTTIVNAAPTATVSLSPTSPTTSATVTATATKADADGDTVSLTFVWSVDATVVKTTANTSAVTDSLNLGLAGNGDKGQVVSVIVTPSDATTSGNDATASVTVANTPPTLASVSIAETTATTSTVLHASAGTTTDADGDTVTIAYQWTNGGADIAGATGSTLDLSVAGNGDKGQVIRVRATPSDGTSSGTAVTSSGLTIADSAPSTTVVLDDVSPDSNAIVTATATPTDPDNDPVTLTYVWQVNGVTKKTTSNTTSLTDAFDLSIAGNGDPGDIVTVRVTPSDGTLSGTASTASATVVADTTAPSAPGTISASTTSAAIALDWPDNSERDLAGYRVSRASSASGPFTDITATITSSAFTDTAPVVGDLTYRVVAIDTTGNESGATSILVTRSIALRSVATAQSTTTSLSVSKPAGASIGDVLVAMVDVAGNAAITGSGWTPVRSDTNGSNLRQAVLTRVVGSESGPYAFTLTAAQGSTAIVAAYVGVDPTTPVDASSVGIGSGTSITAPSVTSGDHSLLIMFSGIAASATVAPAAGMAERAELGSSGKTKLDAEMADELRGASGATGSRTSTASKAGTNIAQLVALRAAGSSAPQLTEPGAPTSLSASAVSGAITLTWTAPANDGGAQITNYRIYRSAASGTEAYLTQVGNVTTFQDTGLTNGITYFYRVSAVNSVGEGAMSNEATATPVAASVPGAPTNLTASPGRPRGIALTWTAPTNNGGSPITGYEIWRGTAAGTETKLAAIGTATSYKDTSTTKGTTYWYYIVAVNLVGPGSASLEVSAVAR